METETPAVAPEASSELGVAHYFKGKRLEPFSFARQSAFQRLRVGSESTIESAAMLVFLCLQKPERIDRARGEEGCARFRLDLSAWADEQKIGISYTDEAGVLHGSKAGHEVQKIASEVWSEIAAAESEPDLKDETGTESPNA
jgi:hypothetical protein